MASSNADSPNVDPAAFEATTGVSPQDYVNSCAVGLLLAPNLAAAKATLAELAAKRAPGGHWELLPSAQMADAAAIETQWQSQVDIVHQLTVHQDAAKAFIDAAPGTDVWSGFRSYLGRTANILIDNGLIDADAVRAALVAAVP